MGDPKGSPSGPTFWRGIEDPDPLTPARQPHPLSHRKCTKIQNQIR